MTAARATCPRCLRPLRTCFCALLPRIASDVELVILQHPLEERHAKGTARMLHLALPGSQLLVGETFAASAVLSDRRHNVLLYPGAPAAPLAGLQSNPAALRLLILDGTWRKTRLLLHTHPFLQTLPRLALSDLPASAYHIRKAEAGHQLSTLEAACTALSQLERQPQRYQPLLDAFATFVQRYRQFVPPG